MKDAELTKRIEELKEKCTWCGNNRPRNYPPEVKEELTDLLWKRIKEVTEGHAACITKGKMRVPCEILGIDYPSMAADKIRLNVRINGKESKTVTFNVWLDDGRLLSQAI